MGLIKIGHFKLTELYMTLTVVELFFALMLNVVASSAMAATSTSTSASTNKYIAGNEHLPTSYVIIPNPSNPLQIERSPLDYVRRIEIARRGGVSDGGSCTLTANSGNWILKDILVRFPHGPFEADQADPLIIQNDALFERIHFTIMDSQLDIKNDIRRSESYQLAVQKISSWSLVYPNLVRNLKQALEGMTFYGTDLYTFHQVSGCTNSTDRPLFILSPQFDGPLLSLPRWNRLSLQSQAGALIKEAFRFYANMSLLKGDHYSTENDEPLFSTLTALFLLTSPQISSEVDGLLSRFQLFKTDLETRAINQELNRICQRLLLDRSQCTTSIAFNLDDQFHVLQQLQKANSEKSSNDKDQVRRDLLRVSAALGDLHDKFAFQTVSEYLESIKQSKKNYSSEMIMSLDPSSLSYLFFTEARRYLNSSRSEQHHFQYRDAIVKAIENLRFTIKSQMESGLLRNQEI